MSKIGPYLQGRPASIQQPEFIIRPNVLSQKECSGLIKYATNNGDFSESLIGEGEKQQGIRNSKLFWFRHDLLKTKIEHELVKNNVWKYKLDQCEFFQLGIYDKDDHYSWHKDTGSMNAYTRKISFSLILNSKTKWSGGKFQLFTKLSREGKPIIKTIKQLDSQGTMLIFPSDSTHRVTPVTDGRRISLVGWAWGPK